MIELRLYSANSNLFIAKSTIAEVAPAGTADQFHGLRTYVRTVDGRTHQCVNTAQEILQQMKVDNDNPTSDL